MQHLNKTANFITAIELHFTIVQSHSHDWYMMEHSFISRTDK
jgi:hypothetical protein